MFTHSRARRAFHMQLSVSHLVSWCVLVRHSKMHRNPWLSDEECPQPGRVARERFCGYEVEEAEL